MDQPVRRLEPAAQLFAVVIDVLQRAPRHSLLGGRLCHRRSHPPEHPGVERLGDEVVGAEGEVVEVVGLEHHVGNRLLGQKRQGVGGGDLHPLGHRRRSDVQRSPEDEGEPEHVVHLVGEVAATGGDQGIGSHPARLVVPDLWVGVGQCEHDRPGRHRLQHLAGDRPPHGHADERVCVYQGVGERSPLGGTGELGLDRGEVFALVVDHAAGVAQQDVLRLDAEMAEETGAGDARRPGAAEHDPCLLDPPIGDLESVEERRGTDDRRAVLIVVEDGDLQALAEGLLDHEAIGCLDVLQVYPADRGLQQPTELDQILGIVRRHLEVEDVDVGEPLEENGLALHHRLAGERANVPQTEHGRSVGHHRHEVAPVGVTEGIVGVGGDGEAGLGDTGGVRQAQVLLGGGRLGGADLDLPRPATLVVVERFAETASVGHWSLLGA